MSINGEPKPRTAGELKPHDHIEDVGTVRWVISPMAPGVHELLPEGGTLVTLTAGKQVGYANDEQLSVYRLDTDDVDPCPERNSRGVGCVYGRGHSDQFNHRFE